MRKEEVGEIRTMWDVMVEPDWTTKKKTNKVMLVLDEPMNCRECPLTDISSMSGDKLCLAAGGKWIENQNEQIPRGVEHRPEWCPLQKCKGEIC